MKFKILFILVLLIAVSQPDIYMQQKKKASGASPLEGNWETIHNPMEASTLTLEFKPNKKFSYILSSAWQGTYKLDGTKLISALYIPIFKKYKTDTTTILIFSDTLIQIGKDKGVEKTTKMIRKKDGAGVGAGLIGTWIMENKDAEYSTISYSQSGTFEVKNILRSFNGNYITKSDTLIAFSQGRLMLKNRFVIDKGKLRLYSPTQSGPITLEKAEK
jgi:hypothetical protein